MINPNAKKERQESEQPASRADFAFPSNYFESEMTRLQVSQSQGPDGVGPWGTPAGKWQRRAWALVPWLLVLQVVCLAAVGVAVIRTGRTIQNPLLSVKQDVEKLASQPIPTPVDFSMLDRAFGIESQDFPQFLVADGEQATELIFAISGESVEDGTVVRFEATEGELNPPLVGVQGGVARTTFRPVARQTPVWALVVVRVGTTEKAFELELKPPSPLQSLNLEGVPARVVAGSAVPMTIRAWDAEGQPKRGVQVTLRTEPEGMEQFDVSTVTTGDDGSAPVSYTAVGEPGQVTLIAEAQDGSGIQFSAQLELVADKNRLQVTPSKESLYATGSDEVILSVLVFSPLDDLLVGEPVRLEITAGDALFPADRQPTVTSVDTTIINTLTGPDGKAEAICRAGTTPGEIVIAVDSAGERAEVRLKIEELKPTEVVIEGGQGETLIQTEIALVITVLDQLEQPMPGVEVQLQADPGDKVRELDDTVTTEDNGKVSIAFRTRQQLGQLTITATAGDASGSIDLNIVEPTPVPPPTEVPPPAADTDGDGRDDDREAILGTDPAVRDDIVKDAGDLVAQDDPNRVLLRGVPARTVLERDSDQQAEQGYQAVKLRVWVRRYNLAGIDSDSPRLLVESAASVTLENGDPTALDGSQLELTLDANDYSVISLEERSDDGSYFLVEITGWFLIDLLDRP